MAQREIVNEFFGNATIYRDITTGNIIAIELWHKVKGEWMHFYQHVNDDNIFEMFTNGVREE